MRRSKIEVENRKTSKETSKAKNLLEVVSCSNANLLLPTLLLESGDGPHSKDYKEIVSRKSWLKLFPYESKN